MQKLWAIPLFFLLLSPAFGQVPEENESIEISTKSLQKANKQVQKELDKLSRKMRKRLQKAYPDLPEESLDSLVQQTIASRKEELKQVAKDSATNYLQTLRTTLIEDLKETPEKLPVADEIRESISKVDELKEMQGLLKDEGKLTDMLDVSELKKLNREVGDLKSAFEEYKGEFEGWDEKLLQEVSNLPEARLAKAQMDKIKAYKPLPEGYRENLGQFQTNDFVKEKLEAKAEEFSRLGETTLQEKFDEAQARMAEAKKKFPSLESVEEAPKRYNPYKGQPFFKRLVIGGNLQVNQQQPASLDAALNLTYPLGLRSAVGLSGAGRIFVEKPKATQTKEHATSIRSFLRHTFWRTFYVQGNYEFTRLRIEDVNETNLGQEWVQTALLGLGKRFNLSPKIKMNFTVFYDLFYDLERSPNNQRWVTRIGFDLDGR